MEIHENGYGLTQHDAGPHDDVTNLSSEQWDGCDNA